MQVEIMMKTPDAVDRALDEYIPYDENSVIETIEQENKVLKALDERCYVRKMLDKYFKYGEGITLVLDTETETLTVKEN